MRNPEVPGKTVTANGTLIVNQTLTVQPHRHKSTGYKNSQDPCHSEKEASWGEYKQFSSSYASSFATTQDKALQVTKDGVPINAKRVPGKPLMVPQAPKSQDMNKWKTIRAQHSHSTRVQLGDPNRRDKSKWRTTTQVVHAPFTRTTVYDNPGIAAMKSKVAHNQLGL